jgi:hypothetical protein
MGSPDDVETIGSIERAVARNLRDFVQAAQRVAPWLGAEAIACAGGVAAFLGPEVPLTTVKGAGPELGEIEASGRRHFRAARVERVVFELAPWCTQQSIDPAARCTG